MAGVGMWVRRGLVGVLGLVGLAAVSVAGLVGYAVMTYEQVLAYPDVAMPELRASADPELVERGRYLVHGPAHCVQCHTGDDRNHPELVRTTPLKGGFGFHMGPIGSLYARNLTPDAKTGLGRRSDGELARVLRHGVLPEGELSIFMRYSASDLAEEDIVAVMSYLRSTEPIENDVPNRHITPFGAMIVRFAFTGMTPRTAPAPVAAQAGPEPTVERGAYLAEHVALCTACHSEVDMATFERTGPPGGGGQAEPSHGDDSDMEYRPPNLTSHPTGITGRLTEDAFVARMQQGRAHLSSIMPWEGFQDTSESDLRSIYRYLRSLPPVDNDTGPGYRKIGWKPGT